MQTNLLWTGREYYSLEDCLVSTGPSGSEIHSTIIGFYEKHIYHVRYRILTNPGWETLLLEVYCRHHNRIQEIKLQRDDQNEWLCNGKPQPGFNGCIDVDIPLTPFTNTLPIRRLKLGNGDSEQVKVVYCDLLRAKFEAVRQSYTRVSDTVYHYENIPNDFEADIEVDTSGFVTDYPSLFSRTAVQQTHY